MNISLYKYHDKKKNCIPFIESPFLSKKQVYFTSALSKIFHYPDLKQQNKYSCGPVSVANGIIWLSRNGFPDLYKFINPSKLIDELSKYLNTGKKGTTSDNMCRGLENFIKSKGYKISKIEYQGLRPVNAKYKTSMIPSFETIKREIQNGNVVLMNFGIYNKKNNNIYERKYGHWVTVTGLSHNEHLANNNCLTIHDSSSQVSGNLYVKPDKIESGKFIHNLDDDEAVLTDNASGFCEMNPKLDYFKKNEVGVINGLVILKMEKP